MTLAREGACGEIEEAQRASPPHPREGYGVLSCASRSEPGSVTSLAYD